MGRLHHKDGTKVKENANDKANKQNKIKMKSEEELEKATWQIDGDTIESTHDLAVRSLEFRGYLPLMIPPPSRI